MDILSFLANGIDARLDDALLSLSIIICLQCVMVVYSHMAQYPFSCLSILDRILKPIGAFLIDRLNRPDRGRASLIIRGVIVFAILATIAIAIGVLGEYVIYAAGLGAYMDIILLWVLLSPVYPAYIAFKASKTNPPKRTYYCLAEGLNQNLVATDDAGQRRNGYKLMAVALVEWFIMPLCLYLLAGLGVAYAYAALSLFVRMAGQARNAIAFTSVFSVIWKGVGRIASIFPVFLIFMASVFAAGGRPFKALKGCGQIMDGNATLAAYAYAQNIALGGAFQDRQGHGVKQKWLGADKASAQLTHQDVIRGAFMHFIAVFLVWSMLFAAQIYI